MTDHLNDFLRTVVGDPPQHEGQLVKIITGAGVGRYMGKLSATEALVEFMDVDGNVHDHNIPFNILRSVKFNRGILWLWG